MARTGRPPIPWEERYEPEPNSGCWLWTGGWLWDGYGRTSDGTKAHRWSYELNVGPIPKGFFVCHKCDTRACVNPSHLFLGTPAANSADMVAKRRSSRGERNPHAKLTEKDVIAIRLSTQPTAVLAREYGVSHKTLREARRGDTWPDVTSPDEPDLPAPEFEVPDYVVDLPF